MMGAFEIHECGLGHPMTRNPHPDAGKPGMHAEVGALWECIPCLVSTRHKAMERHQQIIAERDAFACRIDEADALIADLVTDWSDCCEYPGNCMCSMARAVRHVANNGLVNSPYEIYEAAVYREAPRLKNGEITREEYDAIIQPLFDAIDHG